MYRATSEMTRRFSFSYKSQSCCQSFLFDRTPFLVSVIAGLNNMSALYLRRPWGPGPAQLTSVQWTRTIKSSCHCPALSCCSMLQNTRLTTFCDLLPSSQPSWCRLCSVNFKTKNVAVRSRKHLAYAIISDTIDRVQVSENEKSVNVDSSSRMTLNQWQTKELKCEFVAAAP